MKVRDVESAVKLVSLYKEVFNIANKKSGQLPDSYIHDATGFRSTSTCILCLGARKMVDSFADYCSVCIHMPLNRKNISCPCNSYFLGNQSSYDAVTFAKTYEELVPALKARISILEKRINNYRMYVSRKEKEKKS